MGYREKFAQALEAYGQQKDPAMAQYEQELMKPQAQDNRGVLATIDALGGTNFTGQLPKQESTKDRLAQLLQLRQGVEGQKLKGLGQLADMETRASERAAQQAFQEKMFGLKALQARNKMAQGPKLGSEDKKALGFTQTLSEVLPKYRAALKKSGEGLRPGLWTDLTGDTEATALRKMLVENYGRLQSGGAISGDEEKRFGSLFGSVMDSPEQIEKKLQAIEEEIGRKQALYGGGSHTPTRAPSQNNLGSIDLTNMDIDGMSDEEILALGGM